MGFPNFLWLVFAHFVGDIALQSGWQANNKGKYWYVMLAHCMIWTALICIALQYLQILTLWKFLFLLAGHFICDNWKAKIPKTPENWKWIYPDQGFHFLQLVIVYIF
jgi:hypothetical protein